MTEEKHRYIVTGDVADRGEITHIIRATDDVAAWERFRRAYAGLTADLRLVQKVREE